MKKIVKVVGIVLLLLILAIQIIRPDKNEGGYESLEAFITDTKPSEDILSILKTHCFDCHSHQTHYPWYAEISPVSLWLEDHISEGKEELNMAAWNNYSIKKKDHKLEELIEEVEKGNMPLDSYTWVHGKLSEKDQKKLIQWATLARFKYQMDLKISSK